MTLRSPAFANGAVIPVRFTCDGDDISPHLEWNAAPEGTRAFALVMDDPDAPRATWVHLDDLRPAGRDARNHSRESIWSSSMPVGASAGRGRVHASPIAVPAHASGVARLPSTKVDRWVLARIQRTVASAPIRFELWDGFALGSMAGPCVGTVRFKSRRALFDWVWDPDLNLGETYMSGAVETRGDLTSILEAIYRALGNAKPRAWWLWQPPNDRRAAQHNVHHHYDLGNDFYRLWLDREMVYTCAYFPTPHATLEDAQVAKMDLVCRKLCLKPGDHVIEAGCGWGSLALFMATHYGVSVRAFNISSDQIAYARSRAKVEGLTDRVDFLEDDYRNIRGTCDAFVSVGMLEHVGAADYPTFGRVIDRSLSDKGRGLLHFIGRNQPAPLNPWIRKRIFPGAYVPTLHEVFAHVLEPHAFSVLDVENLRLHYAKTLEHWRRRFGGSSQQVSAMFGDTFVRAWELYLAGSEAAFSTGALQLFQVLFARGADTAVPWTRVAG
jgi:cyclopropane-fatty-acyl-phospholipid synthase